MLGHVGVMHSTTPLENLDILVVSRKETGARHTNKDNKVLNMIKIPRVVHPIHENKQDR